MDPETTVTDNTLEQPQVESPESQGSEDDAAARAAYASAKHGRVARSPTPPASTSEAQGKPETTAPTGDTPPADSPTTDADASQAAAPAPEVTNASAAPTQPDRTTELFTMLTDLKSQVAEFSKQGGATGAEIRKLYGEIGSINQLLKQQSKSDDAPADMADAIARAEKAAEDFPEITGPFMVLIKAMRQEQAMRAAQTDASQPTTDAQPQPSAADPNAEAQQREQARAEAVFKANVAAVKELHPDFWDMKKTPEFQAWYAKQPEARRRQVETTSNPAVMVKLADDYKANLKRKVENQQRLGAAVTPQGTTADPRPKPPSDEDAARDAYLRFKSKRR